jgi:hypothetical protein
MWLETHSCVGAGYLTLTVIFMFSYADVAAMAGASNVFT